MPVEFSAQSHRTLDAMRQVYPDVKSLLLTALKLAQEEFGHLSHEVMVYVAGELELSESVVAGVATFYHNLFTRPKGRHIISICRTLSCELAGGREVAARFKRLLGIDFGETTADGLITLHGVECLACCGTAPAVQIDYEYYENFQPQQCEEVIDALREGRRPPGGSGVPGGWPAETAEEQV